MAVDGATKEKKKKKKIRVEEDAGNTNVVQCHDVSVQTGVKKEPLEVNTRDEEKKKKKKKVKEEVEAIPVTVSYDASVQTTVKAELSETNISDAPEKTIKKKKRKMKEEPEPLQEIISEDGECLVSKKKKAKKKGCTDEVEGMKNKKMKKKVEVKEEEEEVDFGHGVETVEKKKKKKRKNEQELNTELEDGETKKKRKKKEADECKEEKVKKKKKKKKPSADDISSNEKPEKKSKKQKKNFKAVDEGESHPHANGGHVSSPDKKTKRKEKADDVIEKVEAGKKGGEEDGNKTLEEVKKQRASRAAIVFLSAKPGNQDEVSIDQERRLALQRDVDKESQPKPNLGQWGTVRFDSSDRQEKFLRLMGGFKKSSQPVAGSSGSANMALGKEGQQTLQQGLLGEFERAQSRHMNFKIKGAGLGFTAPSNKKFTIDTNARNSIRFDD
ncbi:lysine-rich nucleolar protein 1 [Megalobrama amblycephala]|uniref:lysine-rich nucleolar protein 1 n=1 Tax=Megalobrama amblycephala TaxID=75352 RepID=UPI0020140AE0|nr:lysine-rich nucleolar protein 1 [Megalobrama amblycephala]